MERLEEIFTNQEKQLEVAKVVLTKLAMRIGAIDLTRLILETAERIRPHDNDSMRKFSYGSIFKKLSEYGYVTDDVGYKLEKFTLDTRIKMPMDAELFFRQNYLENQPMYRSIEV